MILDWPKNACTFLELLAKQKVKAWVVICILNCGLWLLIREVRGVKSISRLYPIQSRDSSLRNVIVNSKVAFLSCPDEAVPDYMRFLMNHKRENEKTYILAMTLMLDWGVDTVFIQILMCAVAGSIYLSLPRNCV